MPSLDEVKKYIEEIVVPTLPECVRLAVLEALLEGKLRSMPNSWLPSSQNKTSGMILIGDAMNMRHPLVGGGMTVGLNDVVLLGKLLDPTNVPSFRDTGKIIEQMKQHNTQRKNVSMTLNVLAQALYALFVADGKPILIYNPEVYG
jgi:squalene monooxygenase